MTAFTNQDRNFRPLAFVDKHELGKLPPQIATIFSGDEHFIHRTFWGILKKNKFSNLKRQPGQYIQMLADDIYQTIWIQIWTLYSNRSLCRIRNKKAYIKQIVRFKIIDTDKWLSRFVSYDDLLQKKIGRSNGIYHQ